MHGGRPAFACAVAAVLLGLAGLAAAARHEEPVVVSTQGELPEAPPTGLLPPEGGDEEEPAPLPEPAPHEPQPDPPPEAAKPQPQPAQPPSSPDDPYAHVEPRGTLRPTARTTQPATKPTFDRAFYDVVAELRPQESHRAHGHAGASRTSGGVWRITVVVDGLVPNARYSILVTRPEPSYGTPGPTPCEFQATARGWGTCTGEMWVTEGGQPQGIALFSGSGTPHASGSFS
ncbi:MAG TPA: hypothetical protein VHF47_03215 [Acidimicrobiales bacterium]|nr:hypothetical protein [Acidimicrobiales bacterium]